MTNGFTDGAPDIVLVLSGGNALGAFQAGVYQALAEGDLLPDWIIGVSIGAINGALIAGAAPEDRVDRLRRFWRPSSGRALPWWRPVTETGRRTAAAAWTMLAGRPGIFGPLLSATLPWADTKASVFETEQLAATLATLVDVDRLNGDGCRYTATAVDMETGDDVVFDTIDRRIEPVHVRASGALPVLFPPVEVEGRWLVDGGLSANLPLDPLFERPPSRPTLCIAVDLLPLNGGRPRTIGEAASRMQDLTFAAQSRRTIARWQAAYARRSDVSIALARIAYRAQEDEVAGKAMDFSPETVERRWAAGEAAGRQLRDRLARGAVPIGAPGLACVELQDG